MAVKLFSTNRYGRFALKAFKRMFRAVGRRFSPTVPTTPDWFLARSWTPKQEVAYREWFVREARRDLRWSKRQATKEAGWFLLFYGWKTEEPDTSDSVKQGIVPARGSRGKTDDEKGAKPGHGIE